MSKRHKKLELNQRCLPDTGSSPGVIYMDDKSLEPKITLHTISTEKYETQPISDISDIRQIVDSATNTWIEIKGFKSLPMFETLQRELNINKLTLEDITGLMNGRSLRSLLIMLLPSAGCWYTTRRRISRISRWHLS
jgi:magnesium transporter